MKAGSVQNVARVARDAAHLIPASVMLLALVLPATASAHMGRSKVVEATPHASGAELSVQLSAIDAAVGMGLGTRATDEELGKHAELLTQWLATRLVLVSDSGACRNTSNGVRVIEASGNTKRMLEVALNSSCPSSTSNLRLRDESLRGHDDHETLVSFGPADARQVHILRDADSEIILNKERSTASVMATFVYQGVIHLVTGYDHLLFLVSLILAAGLLGLREGTRSALKSTAALVTAFTVGHSITLVVAALELFTLPIEPVEATIALSIVFVAALNIFRPSFHAARPWLAFGFGLIHGFGFSSVLGDVGLPVANRVVALLSFNIGIELGQLCFVAVLLMPLIWMARRPWYRLVVMTGGSTVVACFGLVWFAQRAFAI